MKFRSLLVMALVLAFAAPVLAESIVIKFSHVVAVDTPKGQAAEYRKAETE